MTNFVRCDSYMLDVFGGSVKFATYYQFIKI